MIDYILGGHSSLSGGLYNDYLYGQSLQRLAQHQRSHSQMSSMYNNSVFEILNNEKKDQINEKLLLLDE